MPLRGVIFDLDGTLIDSRLDFDAMRRDMELTSGEPILEALDALPAGEQKERCLAILRDHELRGAHRATLMPGAGQALAELTRVKLPQAILTRNSRETTDLVLNRLQLNFSHVLTREDAPPKPDPAGLLRICAAWGCAPRDAMFVGDFLFDLLAGRRAGMATVLYAPDGPPDYADQADFVFSHFSELLGILEEAARS